MEISPKLVTTLKSWARVETPVRLFHGCRSGDQGVDVGARTLIGNKWFSQYPHYAGQYAWNMSALGTPVRATVHLRAAVSAVECPAELRGVKFVEFLADCFPQVPPTYALSRHFQDVLRSHLLLAFGGSVHAYLSHGGNEVLLPACEEWIVDCEFMTLPPTKDEYMAQGGLVPL